MIILSNHFNILINNHSLFLFYIFKFTFINFLFKFIKNYKKIRSFSYQFKKGILALFGKFSYPLKTIHYVDRRVTRIIQDESCITTSIFSQQTYTNRMK